MSNEIFEHKEVKGCVNILAVTATP